MTQQWEEAKPYKARCLLTKRRRRRTTTQRRRSFISIMHLRILHLTSSRNFIAPFYPFSHMLRLASNKLTSVVNYCVLKRQVSNAQPKIVIIGSGISGVTAAHRLVAAGFRRVHILEATGRSGGRIQTGRLGERQEVQPLTNLHCSLIDTCHTTSLIQWMCRHTKPSQTHPLFFHG